MQVFRAIALVLFLALAVAMVTWQGMLIFDLAGLGGLETESGGLVLCIGVLVLCGIELALMRMAGEAIHKALWVVTAPIRWLVWGFARLIMGKGVDVTGFWKSFQLLIALFALNVALPLALSAMVAPNLGLPAGIAAVLLQFFLFTDWHMGRALIHFFTSGASAFVSMRYLRKRPISLASVIGVAAGVGVLIVVNSIMNGFVKDYREQIRGSLSHVLLYLSPRTVVERDSVIEADVWRESVAQVKANEATAAVWEHAKAIALEAYMEGREASFDNPPVDKFPSGRTLPANLDGRAAQFVEDLEAPSPSRIGFMKQTLPSNPNMAAKLGNSSEFENDGGIATPENIMLWARNPTFDRAAISDARQNIRSDVRTVKYVPKVTAFADHLTNVASKHPDFEAASPRIRNIALLKGGLIPSSPEDASMIVAVDPSKEPLISDLGKYAAAAEFQAFKESHHLRPSADILNYLLVFEALDAGPVESDLRAISVASAGDVDDATIPQAGADDLPPFEIDTPKGKLKLIASWRPNDSLLSARRYVDSAYNVNWGQLDGIRWRVGGPGSEMYRIVREGMKEIARADQPEPLKAALVRMNERLVKFCNDWLSRPSVDLAKLAPSTAVRLGPQFGYYGGDDAAIMFFRDRFLDGLAPLKGEISRSLGGSGDRRGLIGAIRRAAAEPDVAPEMPAGFEQVVSALEGEVAPFIATVLPAQTSTEGVMAETRKLFMRMVEIANIEANAVVLGEAFDASLRIRNLFLNIYDPEDFLTQIRLDSSMITPLSEMIGEWDENWTTVEARRTAYATVLPLRTRLLEQEEVTEYLVRARAILPVIPPQSKVWRDLPETIERARRAALALARDAFAAHRLADKPLLGVDGKPVVFAGLGALRAELASRIASWESGALASASDVAGIQASLDAVLVPSLGDAIDAAATGVGSTVADALRRRFAPVMDRNQRSVYWLVRATKPGLLLGDTLARRNVAAVGADLKIMVVRQSDGASLDKAAGRTGDETFVVGGVYRSGIFADNAQTMYTDFESYAALLGETNVTTLVGVKLKDYGPWEGRPLELKEEFEELFRTDRQATMRMPVDRADALSAGRLLHASALRAPVRVDIWELERAKLLKAVEREKTLLTLLLGLNMVLAGVVILIVVYLTVVEKVKDIGILKALGASPWGIRSIFMFNALFIGLFGTLIGGAAGVLISQNLNAIEDWIDATFGLKLFPPDIYYLTYVPSVKGLPLIELAISIGAPATLWAFFCGILPAMAASKKETVEALHYE